MRLIVPTAAAFALALSFAAPAQAQDPVEPAPAAEAPSAAEAEMAAKGEAFEARMGQMQSEIQAAIAAAGADQTKGMADVEAVLARYQPDIDGFIVDFETFIDAQAGTAPDDATRAQLSGAKIGVRTALSGLPAQVRAGAQAALAAQAAPPPVP